MENDALRNAEGAADTEACAEAEAMPAGARPNPAAAVLGGPAFTVPANAPAIRIPTLCNDDLDPLQFAQNTCFAAGHLVTKNAGWRQVRPVIDPQACTACLQCYLYCPDGTIRKTHADPADSTQAAVFVDLDFCKGCGICKTVCKFDAIRMVPESEVD